ncbi:MAG: hypothetical protein IJ442_04680 [Bacteroidaceae bacterium]|nr:hypothetical protein [Alistipes sp.]MBQ8565114.1 hypothetical protein [Bacteroidaceae bacterium]
MNEEKHLDEHRSIEIISRMIADTSAHIDSESGKYFLLWGYTTVLVSLFEYVAQVSHLAIPLCLWAWFLIPAVGGIGTLILSRRATATRPKSYLDRSVNAVWMVFGLSFGMAFIAAIVYGASILYLTALLMGMATVITGKICRHKVLTIAGKAGIVLSLLIPAGHLLLRKYGAALLSSGIEPVEAILYVEILIFALIFVVMMVIPGHILYNRSKRVKNA